MDRVTHLVGLASYLHRYLLDDEWMSLSAIHTSLYSNYPFPGDIKNVHGFLESKQYLAGLLATHFERCFRFRSGREEGEVYIAKDLEYHPDEARQTLLRMHPHNLRLVEETLLLGETYKVVLVKLLDDDNDLRFTFRQASKVGANDKLVDFLR